MYEHKEINLISMKQHWTVYQLTMSTSIQQHGVHLCCLSKCQPSGRLIVANCLMPKKQMLQNLHMLLWILSVLSLSRTSCILYVKDQLYPVCQGPGVSCVTDQLYLVCHRPAVSFVTDQLCLVCHRPAVSCVTDHLYLVCHRPSVSCPEPPTAADKNPLLQSENAMVEIKVPRAVLF